ncbi:MAG: T9SS type A sorting domain-containing protein [Bacteroidetes bacterium]|nr:T9SS type A sorting domain-containing protein [Bacteroidota bacterium]
MKNKKAIIVLLLLVPSVVVFTSGTLWPEGILGYTGSPGEFTCVKCHGAGAGATGLQNNAGPGSIVIESHPLMTNNQYVPGKTYHMSVKVTEIGRSLFGFNFEALDNTGNTNPLINNSIGQLKMMDAAATQITANKNQGRVNVAHIYNGGASTDSKTFFFEWIAPNSGTVNMYATGIAANKNGVNDVGDHTYSTSLQLTPEVASALSSIEKENTSIEIFPNPSTSYFKIKFNGFSNEKISANIMDINGKLIKTLFTETVVSGENTLNFSTQDLETGSYLIHLYSKGNTSYHKLIVQ